MQNKKQVVIYTDGACSGNPGPGGWAAILSYKGREKEIAGGERETTNNRMELTAVIRALESLREPCEVALFSDSRYVVDAMAKGWAKKWRMNGWKRGKNEEAKNPELWAKILDLSDLHKISWNWVKGHAQNEQNSRCDALAVAESKKIL